MRKWNPYNLGVTDELVVKFAVENKIPQWYSKVCLHMGYFITHVLYFVGVYK